jgi:ketosteroid isomerase-like protein
MSANEELVRRGYKAFTEGDMDTLKAIMTPDVVHRVPGNNQTSGDHKGIDDVLGMYGLIFELSNGTLNVELRSVEAEGDDGVVSTHRATAERDGKRLDVVETLRFTISGGKITEIDESTSDVAAEDAFWGSP